MKALFAGSKGQGGRHSGERHLGRRIAHRVRKDILGSFARQGIPHARARCSFAHHHQPLRRSSPVRSRPRLIVEITDGDFFGYRANIFYDLVKTSVIRLAFAMLRKRYVAAVALTPGFLRSEAMLDHFGVTAHLGDGARGSGLRVESPPMWGRGRGLPHPDVQKGGRVFSSWDLAEEYGFTDQDGGRPNWGRHFRENDGASPGARGLLRILDPGPGELVFPDWPSEIAGHSQPGCQCGVFFVLTPRRSDARVPNRPAAVAT